MKQQTVIVTGASSGIGKAVAQYFLDRGDNVVINSATEEKLDEAYRDLIGKVSAKDTANVSAEDTVNVSAEGTVNAKGTVSANGTANANDTASPRLAKVAGDVSDKTTGQKLLATALEKFGSADVLVNNAGIFETKPFLEVDEAYLDRFLNTNLKGTFFTTQAILPQMLKQQQGAVINIGTPLVHHALGGAPASAPVSSKGAIHALTLQLAAEFGKQHIRVNTVAAGVIRTPMHGDNSDAMAGLHLSNKVGEVDHIASMVYTIAKNELITGSIINVDGGMGGAHNLN